MLYLLLTQFLAFLIDLIALCRRSDPQKDLEILGLRHQRRILQRLHPAAPRISPRERLSLAVLSAKLRSLGRDGTSKRAAVLLLFQPATVLRGHRELARRKWSLVPQRWAGQPTTDPLLKELVLRRAAENPTWGYSKIHGELLKLGFDRSRSSGRNILKAQPIPPAPQRSKDGGNWSTLLKHKGAQILAGDFFTVETAWRKTL